MWRKTVILATCFIILICVNCSQHKKQKQYATDGPPRYGGTLVVGVSDDVDSFNPLFSESSTGKDLIHMLMLGLADLNDKSEFTPKGIQTKNERANLVYAIKIAVRNDGYLKIGQYGETSFNE